MLLTVGLAACATPLPPSDSYYAAPSRGPSLGVAGGANGVATTHSWDSLGRLETWLEGPEARRNPTEVPAVELELAQGRVDLARRDRGRISPYVLDLRLDLAEAGFRRVLVHPDANALEHIRARDGLSSLASLRSSAPLEAEAPEVVQRAGVPAIRPRASWGAKPAIAARLQANRRAWRKITVHHSATTAEGFGGRSTAASSEAIQRIQKAHMNTEGWGDIGYHFLIDPAGRLYQGRSLAWQGAHAGGQNNVANIGICLLGNFDAERPDARALATLESLIGVLSARHGIPRTAVKGHRAYRATACPGERLARWVESYARSRS